MTDTDESLLKAFAGNRDEMAFRALADRYLGLVFHAAMRRTQNRQMAEEISQNILCALAQKASALAKNPDRLPAWLHRATLYESSNAMSAETSHQRRKLLQLPAATQPDDSAWSDAIPHLDAALDKLPDADRQVLLLHFFENRSFPGIARSLGKSTVAVQKQSQRALEKLARLLRAKGVTLTAATVATGLSAEFAKAAPLTFVHSAATAVLTGTATYSTTALTLMFAAKSKALVPLIILLCALPLALQQVAISNARSRIAQLQVGNPPMTTGNSNTTKAGGISAPNNLSAWKDLARRVAFLNAGETKDKRTELELRERLDAMGPQEILEKMDQITTWDLPGRERLLSALLTAAIDKDPPMTLRHFEDQLASCQDNMQFQLVKAFRKWMQSDSSSATAWFDAMRSGGKLECTSMGNRVNESCKSKMMADLTGVVIADLMKSDVTLATQRFKSLAPDQRAFIIRHELYLKFEPGTEAAFVRFMRLALPEEQYRAHLSNPSSHYVHLGYEMAHEGGLARVGSFLDAIDASPEERRVFAGAAAGSGLYRLKGGEESKVTRAAVDELRKWLARQAPQDVDRITGHALGNITPPNGSFAITAPLVEALYQETGSDDVLIAFLDSAAGGSTRERAALAARIKDDTQREKIMAKLRPQLPATTGEGQ
ncbi:MAG: sigma-70 family RNA polymerase sigma factor [Verrucomicrobia bacterium]|nr:sigma-70 family RNA polymerase sigma factor [Verrucomicrobiota bacterium]